MNKTLKNTLLATTGATIIGATAVALNSVPSAIAAIGGAVFGSLCVQSSESTKAKKREEAIRVASAFKNAYDRNKGVVLAEELSFFADIDLETATVFLNALTESQNGQKISIDNTVAFTFPHTQSVLDTLTKNSQAWVESRTQPLLIENQTLKQQLAFIQAQIQTQQVQQQTVSSWASPPEPVEQKTTAEVDPWKKLL
jgi:hypothetical protein